MSEKNNDIIYSAKDIERYHQGLLSAKDMHAMEKAALEDPFFADAMDGYAYAGNNTAADLDELKKRLSAKAGDKKLIPLAGNNRSSFTWLRAAVLIAAIAGAALLVYQLGFNNEPPARIANNDQTSIQQALQEKTVPAGGRAGSDSAVNNAPANGAVADNDQAQNKQPAKPAIKENIESGKAVIIDHAPAPIARASEPALNAERNLAKQYYYKTAPGQEVSAEKKELAINKDPLADKSDSFKGSPNTYAFETNEQKQSNVLMPTNDVADKDRRNANLFRGQVKDANNNALPFANVTNVRDNVGTYSDAQGRFILTSPDSILNVQVRSLGYENNTQQLRNNVASNEVVLQDDRSRLSEVVVSNKKVNSRARQQMVLEEPEPADGWEKYDTYLANNLQMPESFKSRESNTGSTAEVELSFEVNSKGEPVNIKVVRSLCEKCDQEAIRLLKDGPKWKRKVKNGRTSVKIPF